MMRRMIRCRLAVVVLGIIAAMGTFVLAEQVIVQRKQVDLLKGKGSMYLPPIATVLQGEKLDVLAHEGRWLRVQYQGTEGYVLEAALTGNGPSAGSSMASSGGATDATAATAAKGWDHVTWANNHAYSLDGLKRMQETRDALRNDPGQWDRFKTDGRVGVR